MSEHMPGVDISKMTVADLLQQLSSCRTELKPLDRERTALILQKRAIREELRKRRAHGGANSG